MARLTSSSFTTTDVAPPAVDGGFSRSSRVYRPALRRLAIAGAVVLLVIVASAGTARADPAVPTDFESRVTGVEPPSDVITLAVVGGDAFIEVMLAAGHTVDIAGYFGEPYISIDEAGSVSVNERSPSKYINDDRLGLTVVPDSADQDAAPRWEMVGENGRYAWHDHRTHWMTRDRPPGISGDVVQQVFAWEIPIVLDGADRLVVGTLDWYPPVDPMGPVLAGMVALGALVAWRKGRVRPLTMAGSMAALVAVVLSGALWLATPGVARAFPVSVVAPVFALVVFVAAVFVAGSRPAGAAQAVVVASVALIVFVVGSIDVFTRPILPAALPDGLERIGTAAIGWLAVACGVLGLVEIMGPAASATGAREAR